MTLKTPAKTGPISPVFKIVAKINDTTPGFIEHAPGVIEIGHWNPGMMGFQIRDAWDGPEDLFARTGLYSYGVADSPEQFLAKHGEHIEALGRDLCVFMVHVRKSTQPSDGGWRWHKWGPYVGTGEPTMEYLYDEPGFEDGVWTYSVHEVTA